MTYFLDTPQWRNVERWLSQLDAWTVLHQAKEGPPNIALGPDIQEWFKHGVASLNKCLQPQTVALFLEALQSKTGRIDDVHEKLIVQDLAWQPDLDSTECLAGKTIWRMVIATAAFRTGWDFGELSGREQFLTSFLSQWEVESSNELRLWHKNICSASPWALSTTFDWLVERLAPPELHWAYKDQIYPSERSIASLVEFHFNPADPFKTTLWQQAQTLRPDITEYIERYLFVQKQLTGLPSNPSMGAAIAGSWRQKGIESFPVLPHFLDGGP